MKNTLQLLLAALLPILASVALYFVQKRTKFKELPYRSRQIFFGIMFGLVSIMGTMFGIDLEGATANVRDAGVLCAGLFFGAPAGIIAGLISGIHRWLASSWAGEYSKVACSLATILAGIYAAALRIYMFDDHRPEWHISGLVAVVVEVVHLILLYLTHLDDLHRVFMIIEVITIPMVIANTFSVAVSAGCLSMLSLYFRDGKRKKTTLNQKIQKWLLVAIVIAYLCTTLLSYITQTSSSVYSAKNLLSTNIEDVAEDIRKQCDEHMLETAKLISARYEADNCNNARLPLYATVYQTDEINVVSGSNQIIASTAPENVGYDLMTDPELSSFDRLNQGTGSYLQRYEPAKNIGGGEIIAYVGIRLRRGGYIQTGFMAGAFHEQLQQDISDIIRNRRVGQTGYILVTNEDGIILGDDPATAGASLEMTDIRLEGSAPSELIECSAYGEDVYCMYGIAEGFTIIAVLPAVEIFESRDASLYFNSFMEVIAFALLFTLIFFLVKFIVVDDITKINASLSKIIGGDLNETVHVDTTMEMETLSGYINTAVEGLKASALEIRERMEKDLKLATEIQKSALPTIFPPYPDIHAFDIYAMNDPAREVGGDFYDFFLLGEERLAFVVADVSGKGIPGAMFMMRAKTIIKSLAETGIAPEEVIREANNKLCVDNDAGMFVTAWFGILDYTTGLVSYVNAGHNPPLVGRKKFGYTYLKTRSGLVLAGMEDVPYQTQQLTLEPGDRLFIYTDGVVESTSVTNELYGEDRLVSYLNNHLEDPIEEIPGGVMQDIEDFICGAEQFDDITMMIIQYNGNE